MVDVCAGQVGHCRLELRDAEDYLGLFVSGVVVVG